MFLAVRSTGWSLHQSCTRRKGGELKFSCVWSLLCFVAAQGDWLFPCLLNCPLQAIKMQRSPSALVCRYSILQCWMKTSVHPKPTMVHHVETGALPLDGTRWLRAEGRCQLCCLFQSYPGLCCTEHFCTSFHLHMIGCNWTQLEVDSKSAMTEFCKVISIILLDRVQRDFICN